MAYKQECEQHDTHADEHNVCAGYVAQRKFGSTKYWLCEFHNADLQDKMHSGSMR